MTDKIINLKDHKDDVTYFDTCVTVGIKTENGKDEIVVYYDDMRESQVMFYLEVAKASILEQARENARIGKGETDIKNIAEIQKKALDIDYVE